MDVLMGSDKHHKVACRLIALRVNEQIANERRRQKRKQAKKKNRTVSKHHLQMCDWTLLITNVPQSLLPLEMVRALYTLRWQIELIFKQFKSVLCVHRSNTGKEDRLRCELYGKLIGAVIFHHIHAAETNRLWNTKHREVSMDKLYKRLQERVFTFFGHMLSSVHKAIAYLKREIKLIIPNCLKNQQKSRMTTREMLEVQCDPALNIKHPARRKSVS